MDIPKTSVAFLLTVTHMSNGCQSLSENHHLQHLRFFLIKKSLILYWLGTMILEDICSCCGSEPKEVCSRIVIGIGNLLRMTSKRLEEKSHSTILSIKISFHGNFNIFSIFFPADVEYTSVKSLMSVPITSILWKLIENINSTHQSVGFLFLKCEHWLLVPCVVTLLFDSLELEVLSLLSYIVFFLPILE